MANRGTLLVVAVGDAVVEIEPQQGNGSVLSVDRLGAPWLNMKDIEQLAASQLGMQIWDTWGSSRES